MTVKNWETVISEEVETRIAWKGYDNEYDTYLKSRGALLIEPNPNERQIIRLEPVPELWYDELLHHKDRDCKIFISGISSVWNPTEYPKQKDFIKMLIKVTEWIEDNTQINHLSVGANEYQRLFCTGTRLIGAYMEIYGSPDKLKHSRESGVVIFGKLADELTQSHQFDWSSYREWAVFNFEMSANEFTQVKDSIDTSLDGYMGPIVLYDVRSGWDTIPQITKSNVLVL